VGRLLATAKSHQRRTFFANARRVLPTHPRTGHRSSDLQSVKRFVLSSIGLLGMFALSSCSTVSDLVVTNIPSRHSGPARVVVDLSDQEAHLYRGKNRVASSRISSGREGHSTPTGRFRVIRKHEDHRSSLYGDYVDRETGRVVRANVDVRKHARPRGTRYEGAPMPFYVEFKPSYGLHAGYLPGVPASHGCIRMPYWRARQFYNAVRIGTPVTVRH
jgi:lipoprotein-anchoring transpeptidase ErfK/SrfK